MVGWYYRNNTDNFQLLILFYYYFHASSRELIKPHHNNSKPGFKSHPPSSTQWFNGNGSKFRDVCTNFFPKVTWDRLCVTYSWHRNHIACSFVSFRGAGGHLYAELGYLLPDTSSVIMANMRVVVSIFSLDKKADDNRFSKCWTIPLKTRSHQTYILYSCSTQSVPGYWGRLSWYFLSRPGGTKRPPRKWYRPLNREADFFGAVREMSMSGCSPSALPSSTSQPLNKFKKQKNNQDVTIQSRLPLCVSECAQ